MSPTRRSPRGVLVLALLTLAALLTACGGASDAAGGGSGGGEDGDLYVLKVGDPGNAGPIAYGKKHGLFDEPLAAVGARIEWVETTPGFSSNLALFSTGQLDVSGGAYSPVVGALSKDVNVRVFAVAESVGRDRNGILAAQGSGIESVEDLRGKRVAVNPAAKGEYLLLKTLEKFDIPADEVERVALQQADAASAFSTGQVDAWASFGPPYAEAKANGALELITEAELDTTDYTIVAARLELLEERPEVLKAYLDTLNDLAAQQRENPEDFENIFEQTGPRALQDQRLADAISLGAQSAENRYPTDEDRRNVEDVSRIFFENGVITHQLKAEDVFFDLEAALESAE